MIRISRSLVFQKKVFPFIWFGVLAFAGFLTRLPGRGAPVPALVLVVLALAGVFGYLMMRKLVWDLVEEVYDCGDHLLVRSEGREFQVPLSNVMNVSASIAVNPARITLRLVHPGLLGEEIAFCPAKRAAGFGFGFGKNPIAEDLMLRAHQARSHASRTQGQQLSAAQPGDGGR